MTPALAILYPLAIAGLFVALRWSMRRTYRAQVLVHVLRMRIDLMNQVTLSRNFKRWFDYVKKDQRREMAKRN